MREPRQLVMPWLQERVEDARPKDWSCELQSPSGDRGEIRATLDGDVLRVGGELDPDGNAWSLLADSDPMVADVWTGRLDFEIRLRGDPRCVGEPAPSAGWTWHLRSGLPAGIGEPDALCFLQQAALCHLGWPVPGSSVRRDVQRVLGSIAAEAAAACEPQARRIALRFHPDARFFVYREVVRDRSGRVAQIADACPGALLFAAALASGAGPGGREAAECMLADIVAGRRLGRIVADAVSAWWPLMRAWGTLEEAPEQHWLCPLDVPDAWTIEPQITTMNEREARAAMRVLLRHARPRARPRSLLAPPPVTLVPEDIPRRGIPNATWFAVMCTRYGPILTTRALELEVSRFVSRHAVALCGLLWEVPEPGILRCILRFCATTRFEPRRAMHPEELVLAMRGCDPNATREGPRPALPRSAHAPWDGNLDDLLPAPPIPGMNDGQVTVEPLTRASSVQREAREMQHCAMDYLHAALQGRVCFYSVRVGALRATLMLERTPVGWRLAELAGADNRRATLIERRVARAWLNGHGAAGSERPGAAEEIAVLVGRSWTLARGVDPCGHAPATRDREVGHLGS